MNEEIKDSIFPEKYSFQRTDAGVIARLRCQHCKQWFTVEANDPLFALMLMKLDGRYSCGCFEHPSTQAILDPNM